MMRHLSVQKQKEREHGVPSYLGNSDDVMGKVESSSDWLTGCGAPPPEGCGGRGRRGMTEQRLGCEKQLLSLSLPEVGKLHRDDGEPLMPPTGCSKKCSRRREPAG